MLVVEQILEGVERKEKGRHISLGGRPPFIV